MNKIIRRRAVILEGRLMKREDFEQLFKPGSKIQGVFQVLKDEQWHCRECEYKHTGITQIAGGSGIQGLERGTKSRQGLVIESNNHLCKKCTITTRHDKWTGQFKTAVQSSGMSPAFIRRVEKEMGRRDIIEGTERPMNQLTVDHKLPMIRWDTEMSEIQTDYKNMTEADIRKHFQLLKKSNGSMSHNLLKSRACEKCFKKNKRAKPFGINFFYEGDENWNGETKTDASGCIGCGWYDFSKWRSALNKHLNSK